MDAGCCPEATGSTGMRGPAPAVAGAGSGAVTGRAPAGQHGRAAAPCPPRPPRLFCRHWYKAQSLKSAAAVGRWRVLAERKQGVRGLGKRSSSERRQSSACAGPAEERGGPEAPKRGRCLMLNLRSPPCCLQERLGAMSPGTAALHRPWLLGCHKQKGPHQPLPLQTVARQRHRAAPHPPRDKAVLAQGGCGGRAEGPLLSPPLQPALRGGRGRPGGQWEGEEEKKKSECRGDEA